MKKSGNKYRETHQFGGYTISFFDEGLTIYPIFNEEREGFLFQDEESDLIVTNMFLDKEGNLEINTFYNTNYRINGKQIEVIYDNSKI